MKRLLGSLYLRLVLVLLLALAASHATMFFLFSSELEDARLANIARSVAAQVRLVEELLQARPAAEFPALKNLRLAAAPVAGAGPQHAGEARMLARFRDYLGEELGREVSLLPAETPGVWIDLRGVGAEAPWLFVAAPKPHGRRGDSLLSALLVGFSVFFLGGTLLLWQIQRPLKRLGRALEAVGQPRGSVKLPVAGAGETRVLAERFNAMVDRLANYEEDRSTMLAGVAHDLRTPMTRLRLLVELEQGGRAGEMMRNLDDVDRIVEQFLIYARGADDEAPEERDLCLFVDEVVASYAAVGVAAACAVDGGVRAAVRAGALRRALINLVENALEYGAAPVVVRTAVDGGAVCIAVEDGGSGIPPDQIERALRPFTRIDPSRGGKGHCGLGLVIAARVVEAHGGSLRLANRAGGGLCAEIRLPALSIEQK